MKKFLLLLIVFSCLNALAQGKITGLQELTDDDGTYYYHDIPTDSTDLRIVRTSVQEPEKDPAIVPFLKKWSILAKVEGEDIESVKFTLTSTSGGGIQGLGFTNTFIDNEPPYSAFGDENGIFETFFSNDPYFAIEATPYTEDNAQGAELQGVKSSFSIISYNNELGPILQIIDKETNEVLVETTSEKSKTVDYNLVKDKAVLLKFSKGTGIVNFKVKISKDNEIIRIPAPPLSLDLLFAQYNSNLIFTSGNYTITTESNGRNRNSWLAGRRDISTSWDINFVDYSDAKTYIPDDNFEQALIDLGYDDVLDDYVLTENIENVIELNLDNKNITDFTGLNDFTSLETFSSSLSNPVGNSVQLDVSKLVNLTDFSCTNCALISLDLTNNINLESVNISANFINEIDISTLTKLKSFALASGMLTTLDVTNSPLLEFLFLSANRIETIDISQNPLLERFSVLGNFAGANLCIQVANIEEALAQENWLVTNPSDYSLDCSAPRTHIPDDNFEQALIDLGYDDVLDDYVATARLEEVTDLSFYLLNITDLTGIEAMINLKSLAIEDELGTIAIDHLDLSENVNLETLGVVQSGLQSINLQNNTKLKELAILDNYLEEVDLSNNKELIELTWIGNQAETLELSELKKLTILTLLSTHVEALDLSELTELVELRIGETQLDVLDVSGLTKLVEFNAQGSNLYCIQVNDQQDTSAWRKDDTARFSTDCSASSEDSDSDGVADDADVCPNTPNGQAVNTLGCSISQYADIAVQNVAIGLGSFLCSEPQNCTVDVAVLRDVDVEVSVIKDGKETIFDGMVGISNPLFLESLSAGEYSVCATRSDIPNFAQCYQVSSTTTANSVSTTIVIQNPGQVYSLTVEGNKKYEVLVNGSSTVYEFDSTEKQQIEIPLEVGANAIQILAAIECNEVVSVDIDDEESIDNLLLFPTISEGLLTLVNNKQHEIHGITVVGLNGSTSKTIAINGNPKEIDINMLGASRGVYIVRIQKTEGEPILKKIIIR